MTADEREILHGVKRLPPEPRQDFHHYRLDEIRARPGVTVVEPVEGCYLAVRVSECGTFVNFAGFEWAAEDDGGVIVEPLFQGNGTGGGLRELRHTYWGHARDGYVFYMPLARTIALLEALKQYFDD